jgi:hypothetical protein
MLLNNPKTYDASISANNLHLIAEISKTTVNEAYNRSLQAVF